MTTRSIPFRALLVLGMLAPCAHAAAADTTACTDALKRAFATPTGMSGTAAAPALPEPCQTIGPIKLGMSQSEVMAALGHPDKETTRPGHPDTSDVLYVYPRELNAQLASKPLPAHQIHYSELGVRIKDGKVTNIVTMANPGAALPFTLLGRPVGSDVAGILKDIGGHPEWNASRDYVQFASMPIGLNVDPDTSGLVGVDIANQKQDLDTFSVPGLTLTKDTKTGLFNGFK